MPLGTAESAAVVIVLLGNMSAWAKMIFDARKNGRNGNGSGNGKPCPLHSGLDAKIQAGDTQKADLAHDLAGLRKENHDEHQKIFEDIKGLSIAVAGAASAAATAAVAASRGASVRRSKHE